MVACYILNEIGYGPRRISLHNNLKLAITPNPLGLKYHAIAPFVSLLKNLSLVEQKIKNMQ